jgi:hypothetical protein
MQLKFNPRYRYLPLLPMLVFACLVLNACGGGGTASTPNLPPTTPTNAAPITWDQSTWDNSTWG